MYKIIKITTFILLISNLVNAQTEKGNQTLGLSVNYNTQNSNGTTLDNSGNVAVQTNNKFNSFNIAPTYSYFIANKLDVAVAAGYGNQSNKTVYTPSQQYNNIDQSDKNYSGGVYLRKYFLYENKIGLRGGPYFSYYHDLSTFTYPDINSQSDSKTTTNSFDAGLKLDFVYYPSKRIGLAATLANLSYGHYTQSGQPEYGSGDSVNLALIGNGLGLSLFYTFY